MIMKYLFISNLSFHICIVRVFYINLVELSK
uniref:Uncharacterized protein n=1 Tax=Arundo donax TaxID=35708 RepID=A0A0A9A5X7_ARUDO